MIRNLDPHETAKRARRLMLACAMAFVCAQVAMLDHVHVDGAYDPTCAMCYQADAFGIPTTHAAVAETLIADFIKFTAAVDSAPASRPAAYITRAPPLF